jgi:hypothetical protein
MSRQLGVVMDVENAITQFLGYDSPTCCYIEIGIFANTLLLICVATHVYYNARAPKEAACVDFVELQVTCPLFTYSYSLECRCTTLSIRT